MAHDTFKLGKLTAIIGDNEAHDGGRPGYNGVWSLRHSSSKRSLFVPGISGLNLEHIFDARVPEDRDVFFEPRTAPMEFRRISSSEAELHQPPTPVHHLESWTRFRLMAPHYLDMSFRCQARQHAFEGGFIGLFWASYINAPEDKSLYFPGGPAGGTGGQWTQLCTQRHNDQSTVRHRDDTLELEFTGARETLYRSFSPLRFDVPLFYGHFDDLVWIVMFDRAGGIRFTHSPSGGGGNAELKTSNPAWDFQFLVPKYEVMTEYGFNVRTVLRPRCSRAEIMAEYERWKSAR